MVDAIASQQSNIEQLGGLINSRAFAPSWCALAGKRVQRLPERSETMT
jgi:hypothetical protein